MAGRVLSSYGVPARVEQAGLVPPTLCNSARLSATLRAALLAPSGALLDLGQADGLATRRRRPPPGPRRRLRHPAARFPATPATATHVILVGGFGPTVPGQPALACGRDHTVEFNQGTWRSTMTNGIPGSDPQLDGPFPPAAAQRAADDPGRQPKERRGGDRRPRQKHRRAPAPSRRRAPTEPGRKSPRQAAADGGDEHRTCHVTKLVGGDRGHDLLSPSVPGHPSTRPRLVPRPGRRDGTRHPHSAPAAAA